MSTVQPTDKVLVQRATTLHSAPADMSTVQDTDLLLINRAGVDYKCTVADWKASQSKPPAIASVTLADSPEAGRFTSGTFKSTVVMTDEGIPASTKGIKAYVQGVLKSAAKSSAITAVGTTNYTDPTFTATGTGGFGQAGRGALDGNITPPVVGVAPADRTYITTTGSMTIAPMLVAGKSIVVRCYVDGGGGNEHALFDGVSYPISSAGANSPQWANVAITAKTLSTISINSPTGGSTFQLAGFYIDGVWHKNGQVRSVTQLTFADATGLSSFATDDAITEVTAAGVAGDATGTVGAVDATAKTITLSATAGTWGPINAGHYVIGPSKPSSSVKLFCKLNAGLTVTDLQSPDPGFTAVTGAGPYTVTFPATLPSGNASDVDLPAGTSLTTEVQAVNASATVSKTSNTVIPV